MSDITPETPMAAVLRSSYTSFLLPRIAAWVQDSRSYLPSPSPFGASAEF